MFNKNQYRKTNDKKVLHKVGKQWKVVSVALLLAVAGGAAATATTQANADSTNDADNTSVNSLVGALETPASANAPVQAQSSATTNSKSAQSAAPSSVSYYSGSNGSAASYFDKVDQDNATANKYYKAVNSYVQSLGVVYGPQMSSYSAKTASAKSAASNDYKLANSYSATVNNPKTLSTINSLAAKNSMDSTLYVDMVENNEQTYSGAVSSASADVKAASDVKSLVNSLEDMNFSAASLSASTAQLVAASNLAGAQAVQNSVTSRFGAKNSVASYMDVANKLSAGVQTLEAEGNPAGVNANLSMLLNDNNFSSADQTKANKAYSSAVSAEITAAKAAFKDFFKSNSVTSMEDYANHSNLAATSSHADFNVLVDPSDTLLTDALTSNSADTVVVGSALNEFKSAVSGEVAQQFAAVLASAATSLYGKWNPQYVSAKVLSSEAKSANQSAANTVNNDEYLSSVADASVTLVNKLSTLVSDATGYTSSTETSAAASVANSLLASGGVQGFEAALDLDNTISHAGNPTASTTSKVANSTSYATNVVEKNLSSSAASNSLALVKDVLTADSNIVSTSSSESDIHTALTSFATDFDVNSFNTNNFTSNENTNLPNNSSALDMALKSATYADGTSLSTKASTMNLLYSNSSATTLLNDALKVANGGTSLAVTSATASNFKTALDDISAALTAAAGNVNTVIATAPSTPGAASTDGLGWNPATPTTYTYTPNNTNSAYYYDTAALLSAGVDVKALESESAAISDVASVVSANSSSEATDSSTADEVLTNGLSLAASSANSAENSAVNSSEAYSTANDEDVTLASYFTSSYTSAASSESDAASSASSDLTSYLKTAASDSTFGSEYDAYNDAVAAATNDYKLGVGNAKAVYNSLPHFLDVLKGAKLHSTPNYGSKGDKVLGFAKKGDRLVVKGVNVSRNNNWRGVVRYAVKDVTNGKSGFFTGQPAFSKGAYLPATADMQNVSVKTLKPVKVYTEENGKKAVATVPAGKVVSGVTVVYDNDGQDAHGFTKVETASDEFFTANTDYVALYTAPAQKNNTNTENYNFNLQNPDQAMGPYYNNNSLN